MKIVLQHAKLLHKREVFMSNGRYEHCAIVEAAMDIENWHMQFFTARTDDGREFFAIPKYGTFGEARDFELCSALHNQKLYERLGTHLYGYDVEVVRDDNFDWRAYRQEEDRKKFDAAWIKSGRSVPSEATANKEK